MRILYVLVSALIIVGLGVLAVAGIAAQHAAHLDTTRALLKAEAGQLEQGVALASERALHLAAKLGQDATLTPDLRTLSTLAAPPPSGKMPEPRRQRVEALRTKLGGKLAQWKDAHGLEGVALVDVGGHVLVADGTVFKVGSRLKVAAPAPPANEAELDFAEEETAAAASEEPDPGGDLDPRLTLTALGGAPQQATLVEGGALRLLGVAGLAGKPKLVGGVMVQVPAGVVAPNMFFLVDGKVAAGQAPAGFDGTLPDTSEPFLLLPQAARAQVPGLGEWPVGPLFVPREAVGVWAQRATIAGVGGGAVFADMTSRAAELAGMQMLVLVVLLAVVIAQVVILLAASRPAPAAAAAADFAEAQSMPVEAPTAKVPVAAPPPPPKDAELELESIAPPSAPEKSGFESKTGEIAGSRMESLLAEAQTHDEATVLDAEVVAEPQEEPLDDGPTQMVAVEPAPHLELAPAAVDSGFDLKTETALKTPALELSRVDEAETRIVNAPEPAPAASIALALAESTGTAGQDTSRETAQSRPLFGELDDAAVSAPEPADTALFAEPLGAFAGAQEEVAAAPKPPEVVAPKPPEAAAPKPPEAAAPKPPEAAAPKPPEVAAPKPPAPAAPRPAASAAPKPPETTAPRASVAAAFAASLATKSTPPMSPGDAPTVVTTKPEPAVVKPAAPARPVMPTAPLARPAVSTPAGPAKPATGDHASFRKVFDEFVATRKKCGESTADLTFEKFSAKLAASRDAVMAKHNCSEVRFEVYVKDGKAALKALPAR